MMKHLYNLLALGVTTGLLAGCGGGASQQVGAPGGAGRATFVVNWPQRSSRLIPVAANSIKIDISNGTSVVASKVVARPQAGGQASATFDPLPVGSLTATATARPQNDGTGTPQAQASVSLLIQAGQNTTVHLTMASTIASISLVPAIPRVPAGQNLQLAASPKDQAGNVVLVSANTLQWSSANVGTATVDSTGKVSGVASGITQVAVTETESGKVGTVTVKVPPPGGLFNSAWPKFRAGLLNTGRGGGSGATGVEAWHTDLLSGTNSSPGIGPGGEIIVGTFGGRVWAIDPSTHNEKWHVDTGGAVNASPTVGADGTVYIGSESGKFYALDPTTGAQKWAVTPGGAIQSTATITADAKIIVGADDGKVYALDALDGTTIWSASTGAAVKSSAALATDGTIYIGSSDQKLYALNPTDGSTKWSATTGGAVAGTPAVGTDGTVYFGSGDGKVYALDPATGTAKWSSPTGQSIVSGVALAADGTIYVGSLDQFVYALDPANGAQKFTPFKTGNLVQSSPAIGSDGTVYVGSFDQKLYALNPDLTLKWTFTTNGVVNSSPAIEADGTVYVGSFGAGGAPGTSAGNLYAVH